MTKIGFSFRPGDLLPSQSHYVPHAATTFEVPDTSGYLKNTLSPQCLQDIDGDFKY